METQPKLFGPLHDGLGASFMGNINISPRVVALHCWTRPTTVTRLVIAVVVNAIKTCVFRRHPHVGQEVSEIAPSRAYGNTAPAIVSKAFRFWSVASVFHRRPCVIGFGSGVAMDVRSMSGDKPHRLPWYVAPLLVDFCSKRRALTAPTLAKLGRILASHVMCSLMALVRGRVGVQAPHGFAMLAPKRLALCP